VPFLLVVEVGVSVIVIVISAVIFCFLLILGGILDVLLILPAIC